MNVSPSTDDKIHRREVVDIDDLLTDAKVVKVRHYGRYFTAFLAVFVVAQLVVAFVSTSNVEWRVIGEYFTNGSVLRGLLVTLEIAIISMVCALVLAVGLAVMRLSPSRIMRVIAWGYVFVFRGVPLLVLLILAGNLGLFYSDFTLGIPGTGLTLYSAPMREVVSPFVASVIGLTLSGSAYMSEIVRGGLLSVHTGQRDAAKALGLHGWGTLRFIVLPQAMRIITPPLGNEFVNMLKNTSLVSVIAGGDILTITQSLGGTTYRVIELMLVATIWYLIVISIFGVAQSALERRLAER
ncbi:MAG: amino acid ABC transporter permease [Actinomycetota bacterium]|nr:amino acid ABC transporter permease [Actinomycetota bacterium]